MSVDDREGHYVEIHTSQLDYIKISYWLYGNATMLVMVTLFWTILP